MIDALLVGFGGALGAVSRYLVGGVVKPADTEFPVDTLVVNGLGSFVLGLVTFLGAGFDITLLVGTGACGAFTTFSSFSVDTVRLQESGGSVLAGAYALANLVLAVAAIGAANLLVGVLG